jgi:hypothetical protein
MSINERISPVSEFAQTSKFGVSLAPGFNRVWTMRKMKNRLNGFSRALSEMHF